MLVNKLVPFIMRIVELKVFVGIVGIVAIILFVLVFLIVKQFLCLMDIEEFFPANHKRDDIVVDEYFILNKWTEEWENNILSSDKRSSIFKPFFKKQYLFSYKKRLSNKYKNFILKYIFIFVLTDFFIFCCFMVYNNCNSVSIGVILIVMILGCGIIAKILDIKKYQETWVRHSAVVHSLEKEMLMYLLEMESYDCINKEDVFIYRVLDIWKGNQQKFQNNMEKKEEKMMDIFNIIKDKI